MGSVFKWLVCLSTCSSRSRTARNGSSQTSRTHFSHSFVRIVLSRTIVIRHDQDQNTINNWIPVSSLGYVRGYLILILVVGLISSLLSLLVHGRSAFPFLLLSLNLCLEWVVLYTERWRNNVMLQQSDKGRPVIFDKEICTSIITDCPIICGQRINGGLVDRRRPSFSQ